MSTHWPQDRNTPVDVCLLLEGSYPRVAGGVANWVDHLLRAFGHWRFSVVFIGSRPQDYHETPYQLPGNVTHYGECFIHDPNLAPAPPKRPLPTSPALMEKVESLHRSFHQPTHSCELGNQLHTLIPHMLPGRGLERAQLLRGEGFWEVLTRYYFKYCREPSFTDYFWTIRLMHLPLWHLVEFFQTLPPARLYHPISTGFAGFLGTIARHRSARPLLLTEHGIYTKERRIDLLQNAAIRDGRRFLEADPSQMSYLQELWIGFFEALGTMCYDASDEIVALFEANRQRQVRDGADPHRTRSIPNGIDIQRYAPLRALRTQEIPLVVALVGRVVPIKDTKSFIRAIFIASKTLPNLEGWIIGSDSEEPEYAQECRRFSQSLGLSDTQMQFLGHQRVDGFYPRIGLVAFSSISEGQPLVLLEAYAAGIPAVVTDVGAMREMVEGSDPADRELGPAGIVVPMAQPELLAKGIVTLLSQPERWQAAQASAIARVERFYDARTMEQNYHELYRRLIEAPDLPYHSRG